VATLADVEKLVEHWAPQLRRAFLDVVYAIRDRVVLADVVRALERRDVDAAAQAIGMDRVAFRPFEIALAQAFEAGGTATMASLPAVRTGASPRLVALFDVRNPEAESWLREHSSTLITDIVADQMEAIRTHLVAGMEAGQNPKTVALDLVGRINPDTKKREGGVIGLTTSQEAWAKRYAQELANGDPSALLRKLRDKRFDATVRKALKAGKPLSPEQQLKMVNAYRQRALKYRADSIARTEAISALNQSQMEGVKQGIAKGKIKEKYVKKTWKDSRDKRVRHTHRGMNGQTVPFNTRYTSPSGARLMYPGDPTAPAAERINCRCWQMIKVDFIAQAVDDDA
jgi:hypothetical protein